MNRHRVALGGVGTNATRRRAPITETRRNKKNTRTIAYRSLRRALYTVQCLFEILALETHRGLEHKLLNPRSIVESKLAKHFKINRNQTPAQHLEIVTLSHCFNGSLGVGTLNIILLDFSNTDKSAIVQLD